MAKKHEVTPSSGNVFADLELPEPDNVLAKAEIAAKVSSIISHRRLTQSEAAQILGVDQPKVSALMRGRLSGFSTDRLLRFLNSLGRDVEIVIKKRASTERPGRMRVVTR
jgi:predicted XRE-type DNA-binding protein